MVFFVIVTYNGSKFIEKCLASISKCDVDHQIIVIDNNSSDDTVTIIKGKFPHVNLIKSKINLGFGKANNIGIQKALEEGAEYVFLLNQDAYLFDGSTKEVLGNFSDEIGIISPIHFAGKGEELDYGFAQYILPKKAPGFLSDTLKGQAKDIYPCYFVNAAAWIVKKEVFERLGLFHPVFEHYGEDDEFVIRLRKNGYKLCIAPKLSVIHDRPQELDKNRFYSPHLLLSRNTLISYFKNNGFSPSGHIKIFYYHMLQELLMFKFKNVSQLFIHMFKSLKTLRKLEKSSKNRALSKEKL